MFQEKNINIYKSYPITIIRYNKLIKKLKPDYIIDVCVAMSLETLPLTIFRKTKVISWEHFNANVYFNYYTAFLSKWLASKFAHKVIVLTEQDKIAYEKKFGASRIQVITNPVSIDVRGRVANISAKNVIAVGRLNEQKGFTYLLDAWKLVIEEYQDWKLRIIGNGELLEDLLYKRDKLALQNNVEFIPANNRVDEYFLDSSIYVMSSIFEGLPLVLIEAKSFGLPIVSFNCETGPKLIVRDGVDGILTEVKNIEQFSKAILNLVSDKSLREKYSQNAIENSKRFAPNVFFENWIQVLR